MHITPIKPDYELGKNRPGYVRGKGLHASDIYNDLFADLEPKRFDKSTPMNPLKLELGMILEDTLEDALRERLLGERPGEFVSNEGIIYSPDSLIFTDVTRLGETKLTWMSSREMPREEMRNGGFPPKFDKWLCQIKFYCRCLETPYARLLSCFVNGGYEHYRSGQPELLGWDICFTARELKENADMLLQHAKHKRLL